MPFRRRRPPEPPPHIAHRLAAAPDPLAAIRDTSASYGHGLYLGMSDEGWVSAHPESCLLVLGPPRSGKSSGLIVPNVVAANGPVVSASTKPDVLNWTMEARRQVGRCWVLAPPGTALPPQVVRLRWSPVQAAITWDGAMVVAQNMVEAAAPGRHDEEARHFAGRSTTLLAPMLHAAALEDLSMREVMPWVLGRDAAVPQQILARHGAGLAADSLGDIRRTDAREQSGIWSWTSQALKAYHTEAGLALTDNPNFDPDAFVRSRDTVYIIGPADQQKLYAPLVVGLVDDVRQAGYVRFHEAAAMGVPVPPVLLLLDETKNIAPLPNLPSIVSESGGQGVLVVASFQDLSQARERWGVEAEGFLTLFTTKVVLPGIAEPQTVQNISMLAGPHDRPTYSRTVAPSQQIGHLGPIPLMTGPQVSHHYGVQKEPVLDPAVIHRGAPGRALLLDERGHFWVHLTPAFAAEPWSRVTDLRKHVVLAPSRTPRREPPPPEPRLAPPGPEIGRDRDLDLGL